MTQRDAVEVYVGGDGTAPFIISCEHATNALPEGMTWPKEDAWVINTHWAVDLGIADLTRLLAEDTNATAVLTRYSRLYLDVNRYTDSDTLCRDHGDGKTIHLNKNLSQEQIEERIKRAYHHWHETLYRQARSKRGNFLLSLHSFTGNYEGQTRDLEIGVMHVGNLELATKWRDFFRSKGFNSEVDQPYDGATYMISAHLAAKRTWRDAIMLEIRNDLLQNDTETIVEYLHECLVHTGVLIF